MKDNHFSRTAQVMALFRALESTRHRGARLVDDPFAKTILPAPMRGIVALSRLAPFRRAVCAIIDRHWPGARSSGVARTRLIDDWVSDGVRDGARQVIILGAGFDSRAWRLKTLAGVPVFEVDHPATSVEKRRRLAAAGLDPERVALVGLDFTRDLLADALERTGLDTRRRTIVIWEGVTNYLSQDAVEAVLAWTAGLAPGSLLAFTYVHARVLENPSAFAGAERILAAVAGTGEAWTFAIDPAQLESRLAIHGLTLVEDLGADDYRARICGSRDSRGYAFYRAALASVGGLPKSGL
jgi:methyltransferase (TIGR00027 family)